MVIVFALLVVFVGTIVLAAWVQILATRALASESALQAQQRRIAIGNGRALARQFVLEQMPAGAFAVSNGNATISGGWGGFSVAGAPSGFLNQINLVDGNLYNQMGGTGFVASFSGSLTAGAASEPWTFRVRSRSPFAGGIPLIIHNNAVTNILQTLNVPRLNWTNVVGISNSPPIPETWGVNVTNSYAGYFSGALRTNIAGTVSFTNFTGHTNATASRVDLVINAPALTSTVRVIYANAGATIASTSAQRFTNNSGSTTYTNNTHTVRFIRIVGSASATNLLQVVFLPSATALPPVILEGNNTRPVSLYALGRTTTLTNTTSGADWRACVTLSNAPLTVNTRGTLTMNGLRTDSSVSVTGTLEFAPELERGLMEYYSEPIMWLEDNRTP